MRPGLDSGESLRWVKVDLETQVLNLKDKVRDLETARRGLEQVLAEREDLMQQVQELTGQLEAKVVAQRQELMQQVQELTGRLDASEASKSAVEQDLATSQKVVSGLRVEVEELQHKHTAAETALTDLRDRLEKQHFESGELREANRRLEDEVKALAAENQALSSELRATKKALHDIHSAASRTTKRLRSRYDKLADSRDEEEEKDKEQS